MLNQLTITFATFDCTLFQNQLSTPLNHFCSDSIFFSIAMLQLVGKIWAAYSVVKAVVVFILLCHHLCQPHTLLPCHLSRPPNLRALAVLVKSLEQHSQRRVCEVDEAHLCGSSLPTGHIALLALGRSHSVAKFICLFDWVVFFKSRNIFHWQIC